MQHDDVTVLLVWNGPGIGKKWHFHDIIAGHMERLKLRGVNVEALRDKWNIKRRADATASDGNRRKAAKAN